MLLFVLPHLIASDGYVRYFALAQLIEWRELSTTSFSMVGPLSSAPLYFLGRVIASPSWWCERFNTFVLLAGISVMWQLLRKEIAPELFRKFALLIIAASMFPESRPGLSSAKSSPPSWSQPDCWRCSSGIV